MKNFLGIAGLALFLASVALVRLFSKYARKRGVLAIPNERSAHQVPTPRGGGIVFVILWLVTVSCSFAGGWLSLTQWLVFLVPTFLVSLIGFCDDYRSLTPRTRLIVQGIAVGLCVIGLGGAPVFHVWSQSAVYFGWFGSGLAFLGLLWSTNIHNFMDGLDGVAAVEALFVFAFGGFLFWNAGTTEMAFLVWSLLPMVGGFLVWNWPRASVFMGDAGSYCLGFLIGLFALIGDIHYQIPVTLWVIVYGVFWFDATVTLLRRLWKGENLATPHLEHACHRLHRAGFSHKNILLSVIVVNSLLGSIAIWASYHTAWLGWALLWVISILCCLYGLIEKLKPMGPAK